jgi:HK97 family phage portal protein
MPALRRLLSRRPAQERGRKSLPPLTGSATAADVNVTPERALQVAAVYSCIRVLAETGSMLPSGVFQRQGGSRVPFDEHPAAPLLTEQANPYMSAGEMWAQTLGWMLLRGNGGIYVERSNGGTPAGLWPVSWTSVEPRRIENTGEPVWKITLEDDEWAPIREKDGLVRHENFLHFRSFVMRPVGGASMTT